MIKLILFLIYEDIDCVCVRRDGYGVELESATHPLPIECIDATPSITEGKGE